MKRTVRIWWIVAGASALILVSALGLIYLSYRQQMDRLATATEESARASAVFLSQWLGDEVQRKDWQATRQRLSGYAVEGIAFRFQLILPDGSIPVDTLSLSQAAGPGATPLARDAGATPLARDAGAIPPQAQQALTGAGVQAARLSPKLYLVAAPIPGPDGKPVAALVERADWGALSQQSQRRLLEQGLLVSLFILLLVLGGLSIIWFLIAAPVRRMRIMAEIITRQGTAPRLPHFLARELDQTGQAFNQMLDRLGEHRRDLDRLNRQLEQTVVQRTGQLEKRNRELFTLNRISAMALAAKTLPEAYQQIVQEISSATGFPVVVFERYDSGRRLMVFEAAAGIEAPAGQTYREIPANRCLSGLVATSGQPIAEADIAARPEYAALAPRRYPVRSLVCVPLRAGEQVYGTISLAHPEMVEVDDGLVGWVSTLSNHIMSLSERLQTASALQESEERFELALNGTGLGVWDWDIPSGRVLVNQHWAGMLGYEPSEIRRDINLWAELAHPDDYSQLKAALEEHLAGRSTAFEVELRLRAKGGSWKWVLDRGQVVTRDGSGKPLRMVGTQRDIDERKAAEEELRRRDEVLEAVNFAAESFLSSASWENSLPKVLASLGEANRASRVYVYEAFQDADGTWLSRLHSEWTAPGIASRAEASAAQETPFRLSGFGRWEEELSHGRPVQGQVANFPRPERNSLARLGVRSLVVMPVFVGSRWWGSIGLDDCLVERGWSPAEADALKVAAGILGAAIQRQQTEETVKRLYETERAQRQQAQVLRETGSIFSAMLSYDGILDHILGELPRLLPYDAAYVLLLQSTASAGRTTATGSLRDPLAMDELDQRAIVARQRGYEDYDPHILQKLPNLTFDLRSTAALRWMVEKKQPLVVSDTRAAPGLVRLVERDTFRSLAAAPIPLQGKVKAFFVAEKTEAAFYRPEQAEILALFASQVGLALQNAQLFAETLVSLEREQNLNEVTRAISSALELPTILQNVVRLAADLCGADAGALAILSPDGSTLAYPYLYNLPVTLGKDSERRGVGLAWNTIQSHNPHLLVEYSQYPQANPGWVEAGVHATISVPLIAGEVCLGSLGLFSYHAEKRFSRRDLALIESVGRQAGIAIQNARLFEAAERRAREAETLRQAVAEVTSALELDQVMDKILNHLARVVPYDSSVVFLYEGEQHLRAMAGRGLPNPGAVLNHTYPADIPLIVELKRQGTPIILADAQADSRFEKWGARGYVHGWMGLPLRVHGEPIGYLTMDSARVGAYGPQDAALVQAFADEVAIAIENARLFQQVQRLAITDPLTGLNNRRYFFEAARRELERARRYQSSLSLIMLDIDHFKRVNDTYGHLAGDRVLVAVAARCKEKLREVDISARYGGEEFVFLLPETDVEGARQVADRLRAVVNDTPIDAGDKKVVISISLGVADLDEECVDIQALVRRADQALYVTKETGRGQVTAWHRGMRAENG
jgi:diguanylate cyclase (GGDEF)-like protein/PAS domain S-box-containing protein